MKKTGGSIKGKKLYVAFSIALALIFLFSAFPAVIVAQEASPVEPGTPPGQFERAVGNAAPDRAVSLTSISNKIKVHVPQGALKQEAEFEIIEYGAQHAKGMGF